MQTVCTAVSEGGAKCLGVSAECPASCEWAVCEAGRVTLFCSYHHPGVPMDQKGLTQQKQGESLTVRSVCCSLRNVIKLPKPKPDCPDTGAAHLLELYVVLVDLWAQPFCSFVCQHRANPWFIEAHPQFEALLRSLVSKASEIQSSALHQKVSSDDLHNSW